MTTKKYFYLSIHVKLEFQLKFRVSTLASVFVNRDKILSCKVEFNFQIGHYCLTVIIVHNLDRLIVK